MGRHTMSCQFSCSRKRALGGYIVILTSLQPTLSSVRGGDSQPSTRLEGLCSSSILLGSTFTLCLEGYYLVSFLRSPLPTHRSRGLDGMNVSTMLGRCHICTYHAMQIFVAKRCLTPFHRRHWLLGRRIPNSSTEYTQVEVRQSCGLASYPSCWSDQTKPKSGSCVPPPEEKGQPNSVSILPHTCLSRKRGCAQKRPCVPHAVSRTAGQPSCYHCISSTAARPTG